MINSSTLPIRSAVNFNVSFMIQFPDLKAELFVNMLGYKEPDRVTVLRCLGECQTGQFIDLVVIIHK